MSKRVTAEDVVEWIQKVQKVYRVEAYAKNFADKINALLAEQDAENARMRADTKWQDSANHYLDGQDAEIARLRMALAVFADPANWVTYDGTHWTEASGIDDPQAFATEALKGGPPCPGK